MVVPGSWFAAPEFIASTDPGRMAYINKKKSERNSVVHFFFISGSSGESDKNNFERA